MTTTVTNGVATPVSVSTSDIDSTLSNDVSGSSTNAANSTNSQNITGTAVDDDDVNAWNFFAFDEPSFATQPWFWVLIAACVCCLCLLIAAIVGIVMWRKNSDSDDEWYSARESDLEYMDDYM